MAISTRLFFQTITVETWTGNDGYGAPTFGPPVAYRGRVVAQTKRLTNAQGEEIVSNSTVYLDSRGTFSGKDRITLPEGYEPRQPRILGIAPALEATRTHHVKIYC